MPTAMSPDEYRDALGQLGYSQEGFATTVGVSPRTGRKWALGEARLPGPVICILKLLLSRPELKYALEAIGKPPTRKREAAKRSKRK